MQSNLCSAYYSETWKASSIIAVTGTHPPLFNQDSPLYSFLFPSSPSFLNNASQALCRTVLLLLSSISAAVNPSIQALGPHPLPLSLFNSIQFQKLKLKALWQLYSICTASKYWQVRKKQWVWENNSALCALIGYNDIVTRQQNRVITANTLQWWQYNYSCKIHNDYPNLSGFSYEVQMPSVV